MTALTPGIQAKLDRAEKHLDCLDELIGTYLDGDPYRVVGNEGTEGGYHYWAIFLEVERFPPDELWGPIIGDAVHNLRSALDHVAWNFATDAARRETPRRIEFPVFLDDPAEDPEVRGAFRKRINCLRPECHAVVDGAQPYKTRDSHHPLWILQGLWNTDKHRVLHTAGFMFGSPSDNPTRLGYDSWSWGPFQRAKDGAPLSHGYGNTDQDLQSRVDAYKEATLDVSLGYIEASFSWRDEPYAGLPIRQVLRTIQRYVRTDVIEPLGEVAA